MQPNMPQPGSVCGGVLASSLYPLVLLYIFFASCKKVVMTGVYEYNHLWIPPLSLIDITSNNMDIIRVTGMALPSFYGRPSVCQREGSSVIQSTPAKWDIPHRDPTASTARDLTPVQWWRMQWRWRSQSRNPNLVTLSDVWAECTCGCVSSREYNRKLVRCWSALNRCQVLDITFSKPAPHVSHIAWFITLWHIFSPFFWAPKTRLCPLHPSFFLRGEAVTPWHLPRKHLKQLELPGKLKNIACQGEKKET